MESIMVNRCLTVGNRARILTRWLVGRSGSSVGGSPAIPSWRRQYRVDIQGRMVSSYM
jgi:hypothetical protein